MNPFEYALASDVEHALQLGEAPHSSFIGGGTNLLDLMKLGVCMPTVLIDINHAGMTETRVEADGSLRLGAAVTMAQIARHPAVRAEFPLLRQALLAGATPQLRNAATLGGNLLQRPRCFYFREAGFRCNKRVPGSGCDALTGGNETHAIFGGGNVCIAVHPSDLATALVCLDAVVQIRSRRRERRVPLGGFYVPAEADPARETVLEPGELVVAVEVPSSARDKGAAYVKVPPAGGFAVVAAAVSLEVNSQVVSSARVVLGGVSHEPRRARFAEERLLHRPASELTWREAAAAEFAAARGRGDNDYKVALGSEVLVNALAQAAEVASA